MPKCDFPGSVTTASSSGQAITTQNNAAFAALVALTDYCDDSIDAFAETYKGHAIEFDAYIGAINSHDGAATRYDILIGAGDFSTSSAPGPAFQLRDVNTTSDLHFTEDPPDGIGVGTQLHLIATIIEYEPTTCLFLIDPISTNVR